MSYLFHTSILISEISQLEASDKTYNTLCVDDKSKMLTYLSIVPQMTSLIGKQFAAEASLQEIKLF